MTDNPPVPLTLGRLRDLTKGLPDDLPLCVIEASFHLAAIYQVGVCDDVESALRESWEDPLPEARGIILAKHPDLEGLDDWGASLGTRVGPRTGELDLA